MYTPAHDEYGDGAKEVPVLKCPAALCRKHLSLSTSWPAVCEASAGRPALAPASTLGGEPAALIQYGCALERSRPARCGRPAGQHIQASLMVGAHGLMSASHQSRTLSLLLLQACCMLKLQKQELLACNLLIDSWAGRLAGLGSPAGCCLPAARPGPCLHPVDHLNVILGCRLACLCGLLLLCGNVSSLCWL